MTISINTPFSLVEEQVIIVIYKSYFVMSMRTGPRTKCYSKYRSPDRNCLGNAVLRKKKHKQSDDISRHNR